MQEKQQVQCKMASPVLFSSCNLMTDFLLCTERFPPLFVSLSLGFLTRNATAVIPSTVYEHRVLTDRRHNGAGGKASHIIPLRYFCRNVTTNINPLLDGRAAAVVFTWMDPSPSDGLIVSVLLTVFLSIFLNVA